jgi:hypothetical protein
MNPIPEGEVPSVFALDSQLGSCAMYLWKGNSTLGTVHSSSSVVNLMFITERGEQMAARFAAKEGLFFKAAYAAYVVVLAVFIWMDLLLVVIEFWLES